MKNLKKNSVWMQKNIYIKLLEITVIAELVFFNKHELQ